MGLYTKDIEKLFLGPKAKLFLKKIVLQKKLKNLKTVSMDVHRNETEKIKT